MSRTQINFEGYLSSPRGAQVSGVDIKCFRTSLKTAFI